MLGIVSTYKKITTITFLVSYMVSSTGLSQFLKIPILVQHYYEHQEINSNLSFADFLYLHYSLADDGDDDKDRDNQLPFKCLPANAFLNASQCNETLLISKLFIHSFIKEKLLLPQNDTFIISKITSDIWNPPKAV